MKVRIDACFFDPDNGVWREPYGMVDVKDSLAQDWIERGWAIALPPVEKEPELLEPEPERAVIETPEDHLEERETATIRRRKK